MNRFEATVAKIEAVLAEDPTMIEVAGEKRPLAPYHAARRAFWIEQLTDGKASEPLRIAARGQHLRRWEVPRGSYPEGRTGYLRWRTDLKKFHAEKTAEIMQAMGYGAEPIGRVKKIINKQGIKQDDEVQAMEDALCLVFLETQLVDVAEKEADKIVSILQKTWKKMSPKGHALALGLPLDEVAKAVVLEALGG